MHNVWRTLHIVCHVKHTKNTNKKTGDLIVGLNAEKAFDFSKMAPSIKAMEKVAL